MKLLAEVWGILTPRQRRYVLAMQLLSLLMAFSTITGIAAIAPFFAVLGDARLIDHNAALRWLYLHGGFAGRGSFVVALGAGFIAVMLLANLVNLLGTLAMNRVALRVGSELQATLWDGLDHGLCSGIKPSKQRHHLQPGVGHYGVFSGSRWENQIYPIVRTFILANN